MEDISKLRFYSIFHFVSRSGTLFLHSLLDDHPQILTIPGYIEINSLLNANDLNVENAFDIFCKDNPKFFNTSSFTEADINSSGLYMLGELKTEKIITNKENFKSHYLYYLQKKELSSKNVILALYYSYAKVHGIDLSKIKVILFHTHNNKTTKSFNKVFSDSKYIVSVRNPFKAYKSVITKTRRDAENRKENYYPKGQLIQSALDIFSFDRLNVQMIIFRFEDLNLNLKSIMIKLSEYLNVDFSDSLLKSTFGGLKYWGNNIKKISSNLDFNRLNAPSGLSRKDLLILNIINKEYCEALDYKNIKLNIFEKFLIPLIIFLPLDDEIHYLKEFKFKNTILYLKFLLSYLPKRAFLLSISYFTKFSKRYKYLKANLINFF
jgi:hypothetical protein